MAGPPPTPPAGPEVPRAGTPRRVVDTTTDDALGDSDAVDLLARMARREVSRSELRESALARARAANADLNGVTHWIEHTPRTEVPVPEDAPLAGLPTLLKDTEQLTGHPTTYGSRAVPDVPARACSPFVAHFLGLGLDPIAATTLPEMGLTASTESSRFGATRNPWDTGRSAGGSSGGSAALVAAGVVPLAHANDGGGSIRIPASCCGLVGLKPSRGRLPDAPYAEKLPVHMTVQGVLTRTVRDTALYFALAEQAHPVPGLPPIGHVLAPGATRLRIGLCTATVRNLPISPDTAAAVRAVGDLCASLGHEVVEVGPPVGDDFATDFLAFWYLMGFLFHRGGRALYGRDFDPAATEVFTRGLSRQAVHRAERIPGALRRLRRLARDHEADFANYDVLLTPVTGHPPPRIGHLGPDVDFHTHLVRLMQFCSMNPVQNISGSPAISLPLGRTAGGLPIGVQLAAPYGRERRLLELALELEAADPWPLRPARG